MGLLETTISGRKRRSNHAHVVAELGRGIVSGKIPEGSLLPGDTELSARFGVSRTVLRESMKTLAAKRLVEAKAKVGTRVLDKASWNFFDSDVLGWRFESGLDFEFIEHLAEMRMALAIARMSGNPFMRSASALIEAALAISFQLSSPAASPEKIDEVATNHLRIAHAVASRDPDRAISAMRHVIEVGKVRIANSFEVTLPA